MAGFAWVTLATNDSYSLGALVLAHSLRRVGTKHDLAVLVTPGVTGAMREKLSTVFSLVQEVNVLDSKDEANLALLARPELGITFTKLHCWRLTQYEKCVFVDADTLVIRNCDELFDRDELSAAPDVGWPDCFNSGVFVFKPSQQTFASITSFAAAKGSFDGGDQGLLNQYFSDWARKDITKHLPFIYNMCSTATYSYLPAFKQFGEDVRIIHFIGITKPWLQYFDTITGQVQPAPGTNHLQPLLQLWWNIFCENVHPKLSPAMAGIAGALAKITLGEVRSPEQVAFEEHMRKQSWEQGQIDYMGRDSFDNIWKKISETLAVQPERESSPPKNSPKPEKSEIEEPTALPTEDEPAAKSEAAVPSETQRKAEQDPIDELAHELTKLPSKLTPEQMIDTMISAQSSLSDAAIANVALISKVPESSTAKTLESSSNDDSTIVESRGIREIEPKLDKDEGNIVMSRKNMEIESSRLSEVGSAEAIFPESQVPIQVAESVLEADVKESVSEDIRPVKEEAISSISLMAQESVPAVLETAMEASDPVGPVSNGSDDSSTGIGNGIDAPSFSSSTGLASATVAIVEGPLMPPVQDPQTPTIAQESSRDRREASSVLPAESVEALEEMKLVTEVQSPPLPVETPSQPPKTEILAEIQQSSTPLLAPAEEPEDSSEEPQRVLPAPPESTQEPPACAAIETVKSSPITLDPELNSSPSQQLDPTLAHSTDKPEESFVQSVGSVTAPIRSTEKLQEIKSPETASLDSTVKSVASTKIQMTASCAAKPAEQLEELPVKTKKSSIPTDPATLISVPAVSSIDKQTPADSSSPSTIETTESKEEIISSQSERTTEESSSSSSPVRPARTKEYQIPGTPTITEATPPTSPPIDVATAKSLEEPATTKVTKKIVKKIVKKTTSETRQPAAEGIEADADPEGKKVTKKIVKKVAKKKDEDGNGAESTSGSDKPKKIIKVAKKTTKTTLQTLDAEAPVPETPPPGTSEMPIPPKRKLKVTTKTTTQKSDSEP